MHYVWTVPELRALILAQIPIRFLLRIGSHISKDWLATVQSPMFLHVDLSRLYKGQYGAPPYRWLASRICLGGAFERVRSLALGKLDLHNSLAGIGSLRQLREIDLFGCDGITNAVLFRLADLPLLSDLSLITDMQMRITDKGLASLGKLPLWSFKFDACCPNVTNAGFKGLAGLGATLTTLALVGQSGYRACWTNHETLKLIACMFANLDFLNIVGVGPSRATPVHDFFESFSHLSKLKHLKHLHAVDACISNLSMGHISRIESLVSLNIECNDLVIDETLAALIDHPNLFYLDVGVVGDYTASRVAREDGPNLARLRTTIVVNDVPPDDDDDDDGSGDDDYDEEDEEDGDPD